MPTVVRCTNMHCLQNITTFRKCLSLCIPALLLWYMFCNAGQLGCGRSCEHTRVHISVQDALAFCLQCSLHIRSVHHLQGQLHVLAVDIVLPSRVTCNHHCPRQFSHVNTYCVPVDVQASNIGESVLSGELQLGATLVTSTSPSSATFSKLQLHGAPGQYNITFSAMAPVSFIWLVAMLQIQQSRCGLLVFVDL